MTQFVELRHTIEDGMITYAGLPGPAIRNYMGREESRSHYSEGTTFQIGKIEMVANTGTYIDAPFHRYAQGIDLSGLKMASIANLEGIVIRANQNRRSIDQALLEGIDFKGRAVLIHTGWDRLWRTDLYFENHPYAKPQRKNSLC